MGCLWCNVCLTSLCFRFSLGCCFSRLHRNWNDSCLMDGEVSPPALLRAFSLPLILLIEGKTRLLVSGTLLCGSKRLASRARWAVGDPTAPTTQSTIRCVTAAASDHPSTASITMAGETKGACSSEASWGGEKAHN